MTTILVTGGCGFIGSNFVRYMHEKYTGVTIVNLDKLTYAGNPENIKDIKGSDRYVFVQGDICDVALVEKLFSQHGFDTVVHFAAESHVDRSITGPGEFVRTNVLGTQVLLEAARNAWESTFDTKRFVHISTDEVYGSLGPEGYFTEQTPLAPNSPYSASKAGSDMLVHSYYHTFGFPGVITRCSNNYGPYQFPEKLIPLMIANALDGRKLPVYGDGKNIRDWLFVEDHCRAIDVVRNEGRIGETYNIGGNNEWRNIDIVKLVLSILDKPESLISFVTDRLGHDRRYAIDATKTGKEMGWAPRVKFEDGIKQTVQWYLDNEEWWRKLQKKASDAKG